MSNHVSRIYFFVPEKNCSTWVNFYPLQIFFVGYHWILNADFRFLPLFAFISSSFVEFICSLTKTHLSQKPLQPFEFCILCFKFTLYLMSQKIGNTYAKDLTHICLSSYWHLRFLERKKLQSWFAKYRLTESNKTQTWMILDMWTYFEVETLCEQISKWKHSFSIFRMFSDFAVSRFETLY